MSSEQFTYWLQGFLEISQAEELTKVQVQIVRDHLATVLDKKTIDRSKLLDRVPQMGTSTGSIEGTKIYC